MIEPYLDKNVTWSKWTSNKTIHGKEEYLQLMHKFLNRFNIQRVVTRQMLLNLTTNILHASHLMVKNKIYFIV